MISQHNRDSAFLPLTLKKGYINGIAKGNINQNSKSTIATRHYHGTSLSIFEFPTDENPGIAVKYGDLENSSNQSFWKSMDIHLLTHALKTFLLHCKLVPCLLHCLPHHFRPPQAAIIETEYEMQWHGLRQLMQLMFGLYGLGNITRGVIMQESLTFQQFSP